MAVPLGKYDNQHAGDEPENGPEAGQMLHGGMGRMLVNKGDIIDHQQGQNEITETDDRFEPVPQIINQFHNHNITVKISVNPRISFRLNGLLAARGARQVLQVEQQPHRGARLVQRREGRFPHGVRQVRHGEQPLHHGLPALHAS